MCRECLRHVDELFFGITEEEQHELLWGCTAFPLCYPDYLRKQLEEIAKRREDAGFPDDWLERESAFCDEEITQWERDRKSAEDAESNAVLGSGS